jgi:hypothetical protein
MKDLLIALNQNLENILIWQAGYVLSLLVILYVTMSKITILG